MSRDTTQIAFVLAADRLLNKYIGFIFKSTQKQQKHAEAFVVARKRRQSALSRQSEREPSSSSVRVTPPIKSLECSAHRAVATFRQSNAGGIKMHDVIDTRTPKISLSISLNPLQFLGLVGGFSKNVLMSRASMTLKNRL